MHVFRTTVFWLHLITGCVAGLIILAMSVTGILLAFERQINASADAPAVLQSATAASPHASLDATLAALTTAQGTPTQLVLHSDPHAALEARYGRERALLLNPQTGDILGAPSQSTRAFFASVERIHRSLGLGMQNAFGRGLTGAGNLAFLFMLLSGLYIWLPKIFNRVSLKHRLLFRRGLHARAREWNWHSVIGIWTVVPLFFIVLTGVIMSYPWASNLLFTMTGSPIPVRNARPDGPPQQNRPQRHAHQADASAPPTHSLDELTAAARQQVPDWKTITIDASGPASASVNIAVDKSIGGQPEQAQQLIFNRQTGQLDSVKLFRDNTPGRKLRSWARFLHTGEEFGLIGEIIAALASLGAVVLVYTGLSMAVRRTVAALVKRGSPVSPAPATSPDPAFETGRQ